MRLYGFLLRVKGMRKFYWLALLNLLAGLLSFWYFDRDAMFYCGRLDSKPVLAYGLSPNWFDTTFQINRGSKAIIFSNSGGEPFYSQWVKGSELFRVITAYDARRNHLGVFFKALDWKGNNEVFVLREYNAPKGEEYIYEVIPRSSLLTKFSGEGANGHKWKNVGLLSCRMGKYQTIFMLYILAVVIINVVTFFYFLINKLKFRVSRIKK